MKSMVIVVCIAILSQGYSWAMNPFLQESSSSSSSSSNGSPINSLNSSPTGSPIRTLPDHKIGAERHDKKTETELVRPSGTPHEIQRDIMLKYAGGASLFPTFDAAVPPTLLKVLQGPWSKHNQLHSARFNKNGDKVVTAGSDDFARVWDVATGKEVCAVQEKDFVLDHAYFGLDGTSIFTSNRAEDTDIPDLDEHPVAAREWRIDTCSLVRDFASDVDLDRLIMPARDFQYRIDQEHNAVVVSNAADKRMYELQGHEDAITEVDMVPDQGLIVTASDDGTARIWKSSFDYTKLTKSQMEFLLLLEQYTKKGWVPLENGITFKDIAQVQEREIAQQYAEKGKSLTPVQAHNRIQMRIRKMYKELDSFDPQVRDLVIKAYGISGAHNKKPTQQSAVVPAPQAQ